MQLSGAAIGTSLLFSSGTGLLFADETFYLGDKLTPDTWKKAICRYCGTGCGIDVGVKNGRVIAIRGNKDYPVNKGVLCLKGLTLMYVLYSKERALTPYIKEDGQFAKATWDETLDLVANKLKQTIDTYGPDSTALYVGAQLFTEEMYLGNKLFKGCIGTNNVESNARLCMASAVTGFLTTFGLDEPPGSYEDIENSDCFFLIGSNLAEQHPVIFGRILKRKAENKNFKLIVADPRFTPTAAHADLWLPFYPGTDIALVNSMAYVMMKESLIDRDFIDNHTRFIEGGGPWGAEKQISFEDYTNFLAEYKPQDIEKLTGVEKEKIIRAARLFASSKNTMSLWTMGLNHRKWGTWANNSVYNLHLLTGKICKPGSTALSMTGQPNACGGAREQGMLCHILPAHRSVKNAKHRKEMEEIWQVPRGSISDKPGLHTMEMFNQLGDGKIKFIWIVCSNPAQTLPNLNKYIKKFANAFVVVQDIFPPTQVQKDKFAHKTSELADVFLPSAFWIEKGGIFGNTERRSSLTEKIVEPPNKLRSDGEIFIEVARRMGYGEYFQYHNMESVWNEYRNSTKGTDIDLSGASYAYLRKNGSVQWPILSESDGGSKKRYQYPEDKYLKHLVETKQIKLPDDGIYFYGFKDGKAKIFKRPHRDPAEKPDNEFPYYLTTGRVVHHWHTGTMTMRVPWLKKMVEEAFVEINILDARKKGISNNDKVRLTSRRGSIVLKAKIVDTLDTKKKGVEERVSIPMPGVVFVPFFDANKLINLVTIDAFDDMSKEPEYKICAVQIEKLQG